MTLREEGEVVAETLLHVGVDIELQGVATPRLASFLASASVLAPKAPFHLRLHLLLPSTQIYHQWQI